MRGNTRNCLKYGGKIMIILVIVTAFMALNYIDYKENEQEINMYEILDYTEKENKE